MTADTRAAFERKMTRHRTSPKNAQLERGEATRQLILLHLPGTIRELAQLTDLNYTTVRHAISQMVQRGELESAGRAPKKATGGGPVHIWGQPKPPPDTSNNPWYNAWYERAK